jgi:transposase InsO family protein
MADRGDDHSRAVMGSRWAYHDDVVRMAAAFRPALQRRGVPQSIYLDNGSPFVDAWLLRGCAVLGIMRAASSRCFPPVGMHALRQHRPFDGSLRGHGRQPGTWLMQRRVTYDAVRNPCASAICCSQAASPAGGVEIAFHVY